MQSVIDGLALTGRTYVCFRAYTSISPRHVSQTYCERVRIVHYVYLRRTLGLTYMFLNLIYRLHVLLE